MYPTLIVCSAVRSKCFTDQLEQTSHRYLGSGHTSISVWINAVAPDGKKFMSQVGGTSYIIHVINHPGEKGKDCEFEQRAITLPTYYYYYISKLSQLQSGMIPVFVSQWCYQSQWEDCGITVHQLNNRIIVGVQKQWICSKIWNFLLLIPLDRISISTKAKYQILRLKLIWISIRKDYSFLLVIQKSWFSISKNFSN